MHTFEIALQHLHTVQTLHLLQHSILLLALACGVCVCVQGSAALSWLGGTFAVPCLCTCARPGNTV